jgi:hypothetical protein
MDLREVAHLTGQGGVDGQGAAGNRRPNTRDNAAPKVKEVDDDFLQDKLMGGIPEKKQKQDPVPKVQTVPIIKIPKPPNVIVAGPEAAKSQSHHSTRQVNVQPKTHDHPSRAETNIGGSGEASKANKQPESQLKKTQANFTLSQVVEGSGLQAAKPTPSITDCPKIGVKAGKSKNLRTNSGKIGVSTDREDKALIEKKDHIEGDSSMAGIISQAVSPRAGLSKLISENKKPAIKFELPVGTEDDDDGHPYKIGDTELNSIENILKKPEADEMLLNTDLREYLGLKELQYPLNSPSKSFSSPGPFRDNSRSDSRKFSIVLNQAKVSPSPNAKDGRTPRSRKSRPTMLEVFNIVNRNEAKDRLFQAYLPIALFISNAFDYVDLKATLLKTYRSTYRDSKNLDGDKIEEDAAFIKHVLSCCLEYGEETVYISLLDRMRDLNVILTPEIIDLYINLSRYDYLVTFFEKYQDFMKAYEDKAEISRAIQPTPIKDLGKDAEYILKGADNKESNSAETSANGSSIINRDKVIFMIKTYFKATDDNNLLISILHTMGLSWRIIMGLLLDVNEEDRVIKVVNENERLVEYLTPSDVLSRNQFKLLILFHKMELINIFNLTLSKNTKRTVYQELCSLIENGTSVELLCNVITEVSETFWDMPKVMKFYQALHHLFYSSSNMNGSADSSDSPTRLSEREDKKVLDPSTGTAKTNISNWLIYIKNPLLFFMTLIKFFKDIKEQLDYRDNAINSLVKDMTNFCGNYIDNASDEVLKINLFDKDNKNKGFLDYAFEVKDMNILEREQIEGLIYQMWDQGRHTLQTIDEFMRLNYLNLKIKRFTFRVFSTSFETPIEDGDSFQFDFKYASNSTALRVISEIFWPLPLIFTEFTFSMLLIKWRLDGVFDRRWADDYRRAYPMQMYVHFFLRLSHIVSICIKSFTIKKYMDETNYILIFNNILIFLSFLQFIVYPLFFGSTFWFINITQMLYPITLCIYVLFNTLAMNDIGVLIRIFARMALVVVVFGTVSFSIITAIAYTIHVVFVPFSQSIVGQVYSDLNLFNDLYQGIMTCYEFVFGAVVLVRPYQEENLYTYSMTFVMTMFSFFGNIMLANMLIAFLTSQFEVITTNAKYLTMNMQYGLIKIFRLKDLDTVFSMPFVLSIPALPFYAFMIPRGTKRHRVNLFLRKVIHVINVFIPIFILMNLKLLFLILVRYIALAWRIFSQIFNYPSSIWLLPVWIIIGPLFLIMQYLLDNKTMIRIMLNFSEDGRELLNFELGDEARSNLVKIFRKINGTIHHEKLVNSSQKTMSLKRFLECLHVRQITDILKNAMGSSAVSEGLDDGLAGNPDAYGLDLNTKYCLEISRLAHILLKKFANKNEENKEDQELYINLDFMSKKLKNNINVENVNKLISFEKTTLEKAYEYFNRDSGDITINSEVGDMADRVTGLESKIMRLEFNFKAFRGKLEKIDVLKRKK